MMYLLFSLITLFQFSGNHDIDVVQKKYVTYEDYGAEGDGASDDFESIVAAHKAANELNLPVKVKKGASYYIGPKAISAQIKTNTDFGNATFIIDDRNVEDRTFPIFEVLSFQKPEIIKDLKTLKEGQTDLQITREKDCLVTVEDSTVRRYIRYGLNQNNGKPQTDIFILRKDGTVDSKTPIIWDFNQITQCTALPIDQKILTIKGGHFKTIANQEESKYNYYQRNITVNRSNTVIENLKHTVEGEGDSGAPYSGFITIRDCAFVTVKNTTLTGHKTYRTIGRAGKPVSMGTYDISISRAMNVTFENCSQTNDINDRTYWGLMGSNYCKNIKLLNCTFSRFDAHMGVANATIQNCTLGHMGINAIGTGLFLVENSTIRSTSIINLRSDYGSFWKGEMLIRNCTFIPSGGQKVNKVSLVRGYNHGQHDFGYECHMPSKITFENLTIDDSNTSPGYDGPSIFANFNNDFKSIDYVEKYPYIKTEEVVLRNVTVASEKEIGLSENSVMFEGVEVTLE